MKKFTEPGEWSHLNSSVKFDPGSEFTRRRIVPKSPSFTSSLFVESLIEQLSRLIEKDPKRQRKVFLTICNKLRDMRVVEDSFLHHDELSSLRSHYGQALSSLIQRPHLHIPLLETSRFATEFDNIVSLASGGFGHVFKAKNRLDDMEYAVKKIKVRFKNLRAYKRTLSEVKTLARLNHPNIVQYKGAWLEAATVSELYSSNSPSQSADDDSSTSTDELLVLCPVSKPREYSSELESGAVLYVCMQLCDETLRQWLDRRNSTNNSIDIPLALQIVQQAAAGVAYIHAANVVHHDIKPSNVFITRDMRVLVGDFGLACALGGGDCPVMAGHGGTRLYAAPEQLRRKCHLLSDMFSLGLVLLEMLCAFTTDMERATVLGKARLRVLPPHLPLPVKEFLDEMLATNPNKRPNANELLLKLNDLRAAFAVNDPVPVPEIAECTSCETLDLSTGAVVRANQNLQSSSISIDSSSFCWDNDLSRNSITQDDTLVSQMNTIIKLKADLEKVTLESDQTIKHMREIQTEQVKTIKQLQNKQRASVGVIGELRKLLQERDDQIRLLKASLKNNINGTTCASEHRAHSA